jgi:hypothetical protein
MKRPRVFTQEQKDRAAFLRRQSQAALKISGNGVVQQAAFLTRHLYDPDSQPAGRLVAKAPKARTANPPRKPGEKKRKPRVKHGRWDRPARPRACRLGCCRWASSGINKPCAPGACRASFKNLRTGSDLDSYARIHAGRDRGAANFYQLAALDLAGESPDFETLHQRAEGTAS